MAHIVTLEKCTEPGFDRGERAIMVDGVRWGRTIMSSHGCHGTKHIFRQEAGEVIIDKPDARYPVEVAVRSERKRYLNRETWRPTEERVLEKAIELVATGRLRHPDVVRAEQKEAAGRYRARVADRESERKSNFEARARQALQINDDAQSDLVDRVVKAMEWAQAQ